MTSDPEGKQVMDDIVTILSVASAAANKILRRRPKGGRQGRRSPCCNPGVEAGRGGGGTGRRGLASRSFGKLSELDCGWGVGSWRGGGRVAAVDNPRTWGRRAGPQ